MMMELNLGHAIIAFTALFFAVASYAVLLSTFLPTAGNPVCISRKTFFAEILTASYADSGSVSSRYALQVFRPLHHTHWSLLRHCKLGGLAVLQEFVNRVFAA
jgi:hypothetical protein